MRDLLWRVCFRRKLWPAPGDGRHHLRHGREHRRPRGRRHPGLLPAARLRSPHAVLRPGQVHLRCGARRVPLSAGQPPAAAERPSTPRKWSSTGPMRRPATPARSRPQCTDSEHGRIVHRSFSADYLEKVRGYHTTEAYQKAMRKRQVWVEPLFAEAKDVAWLTPAPVTRPDERQHRGVADRGRAEPEALPGRDRVGPAPCPLWEPAGPPSGATSGSRPSPGDDRSGRRPGTGELDLEWPVTATPATGGFFQRAGPL